MACISVCCNSAIKNRRSILYMPQRPRPEINMDERFVIAHCNPLITIEM